MRMEAFHFLEAALPARRSNSVGDTSRPPSRMTHVRTTSKLPRIDPQQHGTCDGTSPTGFGRGASACFGSDDTRISRCLCLSRNKGTEMRQPKEREPFV